MCFFVFSFVFPSLPHFALPAFRGSPQDTGEACGAQPVRYSMSFRMPIETATATCSEAIRQVILRLPPATKPFCTPRATEATACGPLTNTPTRSPSGMSTHNNQTKEIAAVIFEQRRFLIQIKQFVKQNLILKWKICVKHGFYRQGVRLATGVVHLV